jgi:hypothetical protein
MFVLPSTQCAKLFKISDNIKKRNDGNSTEDVTKPNCKHHHHLSSKCHFSGNQSVSLKDQGPFSIFYRKSSKSQSCL